MSIASFCVNYASGCKTAMPWTLLLRHSITLYYSFSGFISMRESASSWLSSVTVIVIVIVNFKFLKRHSKAKCRAPAYSRALHQIRGVFQRIVRGRPRSGFHMERGCVKSEGFPKSSPWEAQVPLPEGERRKIRRDMT